MTSAGDRPHLPVATEPALQLRTAAVGRPAPVSNPAGHTLGLEEEPALRFHLTAVSATPAPAARAEARSASPAGSTDAMLPSTGAPLPFPLAIGALALAWSLRRRRG